MVLHSDLALLPSAGASVSGIRDPEARDAISVKLGLVNAIAKPLRLRTSTTETQSAQRTHIGLY